MRENGTVILGAGVTGISAGLASGLPVYEAQEVPGGICSSYYLRPGGSDRMHIAPPDGEAYRFEVGGGHWIFGGDPLILEFIRKVAPMKSYTRRSGVYLPEQELLVPYPIQNHLRYLPPGLATQALREMVQELRVHRPVETLADWLQANFGPTLCKLFFGPFHQLYTAGLWTRIAPQDAYKSPVDTSAVIQGAFGHVQPSGYNSTFSYPVDGLNDLVDKISGRCNIHYGKGVQHIDVPNRTVHFGDNTSIKYDSLLSTLPLNKMVEMTGVVLEETPYVSPSVLVINIGALKGRRCPTDHWLYVPQSSSGFHRVGFYSNVDPSFLPRSRREADSHVGIYVEKAFPYGTKLGQVENQRICKDVVEELQLWGWIGEAEIVDPTWIEVAYTWAWPGSRWRETALQALESHGIYQVGRFARWVFQGIADSIRDGLTAGAAVRGGEA